MFVLPCFVLVTCSTPRTFHLTGTIGTFFVDYFDCMLDAQCHFLSPKFFQEAWAQDYSKLHAMCAVIAEGDLVKRTKLLQLKLTMYRSAGGLTWSEFGTSNEIKTTSGQAMKHWKAGLSVREALGSKMKSEHIRTTITEHQQALIRCNQICCSFTSTQQRKHLSQASLFHKMS